jgi:hypothetical protein
VGAVAPVHPWRLVAPWYRWERRDGAEPERVEGAGRPALHKFASPAFVADFLADPQRSVVFDDVVDRHQTITPVVDVPLPGDTLKRRRFLATTSASPGDTRKLFLVPHGRHYLVAAGLHCDAPGFPLVDPASVAEAGFVLRRHRVVVPPGATKDGAVLLHELAQARAVAQAELGFDTARSRARRLHPFGSAARERVVDPSAASVAAHREVVLARRKLAVWAGSAGVGHRTEGWVPTGQGSFGAWVPIDDTPDELIERWYPLRLLAPVPTDPDHAAHGATIYWGPVPTASDEVTVEGAARFTEAHAYELRAFVRRQAGDCPGELVWSEPSEIFRLASFYDPDGCAQRPVELRLPNFDELQASTAIPSVKLTQPPNSSFAHAYTGGIPEDGELGAGEEICFFALPLITIIAVFVLKLFLPIVMFVFGLFWMLKLKLCIPPSIDFEVKLEAELEVVPGGIEASLEVDIDVDFGVDASDLRTVLAEGLNRPPDPDLPPDTKPLGAELTKLYTNDPLVELLARQGYGAPEGPFPNFAPALAFTTPVTRDQVVHP